MLVYLVTVIVFWAAFIKRKQHLLYDQAYLDKFGNFTSMLRTSCSRSIYTKYFYVVFAMRRFVFVAIPTLIAAYPWLQIQLLVQFNLLYVCLYIHFLPHLGRIRTIIEIFNEVFLMLI